jgi:hypothetical protein
MGVVDASDVGKRTPGDRGGSPRSAMASEFRFRVRFHALHIEHRTASRAKAQGKLLRRPRTTKPGAAERGHPTGRAGRYAATIGEEFTTSGYQPGARPAREPSRDVRLTTLAANAALMAGAIRPAWSNLCQTRYGNHHPRNSLAGGIRADITEASGSRTNSVARLPRAGYRKSGFSHHSTAPGCRLPTLNRPRPTVPNVRFYPLAPRRRCTKLWKVVLVFTRYQRAGGRWGCHGQHSSPAPGGRPKAPRPIKIEQ